ncbi:uncharacterized protein BP01DRAFT_313070, partial [Aspergillus saccharolyticus JOP 1030-1]
MGPNFCGPDVCINSCDAKAECNPDNWPSEYVNATTCPLNVCCSKYGFCGTTEDFCGNKTVTAPSCDASTHSITRVIGYYNSAAASRGCDAMAPYSVPQGVYTHLYFAFGSINPDTFEVIPAEQSDEALYPQLEALQIRDLDQELWLSIGGWDFSDSDEPTATTFSDLAAADSTTQAAFFKSLINFMSTYGFTGVDIDWEYPAATERNGRAEDYDNFPKFLASLKKALSDYKYGLSITLPTSYWYLQHFDLTSIEPSVDWFNVMSYDLHGTWDITDVWEGPYLNAHTNLTQIKSALDLLWGVDIEPSKVNLGLAFYGRSYTVASSSCTEPGCEYLSAGTAGDCSDTAGVLFNSEIEDIISEYNLTATLYKDAAVKTITWDTDQWASFDDEDTWKLKAEYAKSVCLGGVMVWSVDEDDAQDTFSDGLASALGLDVNLNATTGLPLTIAEKSTTTTTTTSSQDSVCRFINCGETCPTGFTEITRDDKKSQIMLDSTECLTGSKQTQTLCCPTSSDLPTCRWRGFHNSGKCKGGCDTGEAEVGTITAGCHSGYQSACCTVTTSTKPWSECAWTSSCEKDDTCPSGYDTFVVGSRQGWGGRKTCSGKKNYNYCCKSSIPDAFTNCAWTGHEVSFTNTEYCTDACPSGAIRIAEESIATLMGANRPGKASDCYYGNEAYCCNGTTTTTSSVSPRSSSDPLADSTAYEFEYYLNQWLDNPTCSANEDAQYSATFDYSKRDLHQRASTSTTTSKQDLVYMYALSYLVAWLTSSTPRSDLTDIFNDAMADHGYQDEAANLTIFTDTIYGYGDPWTGSPSWDAESIVSQFLCDIATSANSIQSMGAASSILCELESTSSSTTSKRTLEELFEDDESTRSANGDQPTILAALRGVVNGDLTFHYARWIQGSTRREVNLELAFWIGPTPGTAPTTSMLATYGDSGDTVNTDRWIVFHLHMPLDAYTFPALTSSNRNFYPGVSAMTVYHSQTLHSLGNNADPRAEFRFSNTYDNNGASGVNVGTRANYNGRAEAIACNSNNRWYIGRDSTANIQAARRSRTNLPVTYVTELNAFGLWLYNQGLFSYSNLAYLWPTIANYADSESDGYTTNLPNRVNGWTAYSPQDGAFTTNWDFTGAQHVDFQGQPPSFHDTDGAPVYEGPYHGLLHEILCRDDVAALLQYRQTHGRILRRAYSMHSDNPFAIVLERRSFRTLRALVELYPEDRAVATVLEYLRQHELSLMDAACQAADRELVEWLLAQEPPLGSLKERDCLGRTALMSAALGLGCSDHEENWGEDAREHEAFLRWLMAQEECCSVGESDLLSPTIDGTGTSTCTVLAAAIPRASYEMVVHLLQAGSDPRTRYHWRRPLGSQMYDMGSANGVTLLHIACLYWNGEAIRALLAHVEQSAQMLTSPDSQGQLPLHWALTRDRGMSRRRLLETVTLLLDANPAIVNQPNGEGVAAASQSVAVHANSGASLAPLLKLFLAYGADACVCDPEGRSLLHQLTRTSWEPACLEPDLLDRLLKQVGVNDPATVDQNTALHYLVRHLNQIDAARHLIQHGANVNAINAQGNTPLHELMWGTLPRRLDESVHPQRPTRAREAFVQLLVDAGASMDQKNLAGQTPMQLLQEVLEQRRRAQEARDAAWARGRGRGRG